MTSAELEQSLTEIIIAAVSKAVGKATAPLLERIAILEARELAPLDVIRAQAEHLVEFQRRLAELEGHDALTPEYIKSTAKSFAALATQIEQIEQRAAVPGQPGEPGPVGPAGEPGAKGLDGAAGASGLDGRDGRDGQPGAPGVQGEKGLDGAPGLSGADGRDGTLEGVSVRQVDDRTFEFSRVIGPDDMRDILGTVTLPVPLYRGIYAAGEAYAKGDAVTFGGSLWIASAETTERPGAGATAWRLTVKAGRDGREGREGKAGPSGPKGDRGDPGRSYS